MSDRTTLSVYLDGSPVDVTIYPYYDDVASDRTFLCKVICLASLLDDCTDVKEIKKGATLTEVIHQRRQISTA